MNKKLYFECNSGISGDMVVAALIDLGVDKVALQNKLESLPIEGYEIEISKVKKAGIECCDFNVILDKEIDNNDHDMDYLHRHDQEHENLHHNHTHTHDHDHSHDHAHTHEHGHNHQHRGLAEVIDIINRSELTENARNLAIKTFKILGEAEAKAHGTKLENVHFHEVGAVDSIVDIIAMAICIDELKISDVIFSKLIEGSGTIRCQHGILPVPVPAVANIISEHNIPLQICNIQGEFVTPTGAAIVAALKTNEKLPDQFVINKIGLGAGKRTYEKPSIIRAMIISEEPNEDDYIYKLETNIDDCTGEALGYVMGKLFENGARDVNYFPVFMKKNRPAWQLNVICTEDNITKMEKIIFEETTTIGIRRQRMKRTILNREIVEIETKYGKINVKKCERGDLCRFYPEYEEVRQLCQKYNKPYIDIFNEIIKACK